MSTRQAPFTRVLGPRTHFLRCLLYFRFPHDPFSFMIMKGPGVKLGLFLPSPSGKPRPSGSAAPGRDPFTALLEFRTTSLL